MREFRRLQFLSLFILLGAIFLFGMTDYGLGIWFFGSLVLGCFILLFFEKNHRTLLLVNGLILLVGLLPLLSFLWDRALLSHQVYFVFRYSLFAAVMFLIWYLMDRTHENARELADLRIKRAFFQELHAEDDFLTWKQFELCRQFILKGGRHRGERSMFLEIALLVQKEEPTYYALLRTVEYAVLSTLRSHYDIAYKQCDGYYLTLLQNIDADGCRGVEERLIACMDQTLLHSAKYIQFKSYEAKGHEG